MAPEDVTVGREPTYQLFLSGDRPLLHVVEARGRTAGAGVVLPGKLVRAHAKALDDLTKAEDDIARWVRVANPGSPTLALIAPLVDRLVIATRR